MSSAKRIRAEQSNLHKHRINNRLGEDCILIFNSSWSTYLFKSSEKLLQLLVLTNISIPTPREGCVDNAMPQVSGQDLMLLALVGELGDQCCSQHPKSCCPWVRAWKTSHHEHIQNPTNVLEVRTDTPTAFLRPDETTSASAGFSHTTNDYLHFSLPTFLSPLM